MTRNELYVGIDVIEDEWIKDIESLDAELITRIRNRAQAMGAADWRHLRHAGASAAAGDQRLVSSAKGSQARTPTLATTAARHWANGVKRQHGHDPRILRRHAAMQMAEKKVCAHLS